MKAPSKPQQAGVRQLSDQPFDALEIDHVVLLGGGDQRGTMNLRHRVPGVIIPIFDEEVFARGEAAKIYRNLKQQNKAMESPYFNDLEKVDAAGFWRSQGATSKDIMKKLSVM